MTTTLAATIEWSNTITLGAAIIGILLGIAGLATFAYGAKYKAAAEAEAAVAKSYREGRDAYQARADRLEETLVAAQEQHKQELVEAAEARHTLKSELSASQMKTDLTGVLKQMADQHTELVQAVLGAREAGVSDVVAQLQAQEDRHVERHGEIAHALREITKALEHMNDAAH